jgi:predicted MPP superfamily phosphohydrolase
MGNHDVWHGTHRIASDLHQLGIRPLINESVRIQAPGGPLWITGLDSAWAGRPNLRTALNQWNQREPNLILYHEPDAVIPLASQANLAAVQLSGHTHGGQVARRANRRHNLVFTARLNAGHYQKGESHLYVTNGVGAWFPLRVNCPPEIAVIEMRSR